MLKRVQRRTYITHVLRELQYFNNYNDKGTTVRTHASFDPCLLCFTLISKMFANSCFQLSCVYAAPKLWNELDLDYCLLII